MTAWIPALSLAWFPSWEPFAWIAVGLFWLAVCLRWRGEAEAERSVSTLAWWALALLWLVMLPYFALEVRSPVETALAAIAVPASVWAGVVRWRGRAGTYRLGKAAAIAGSIYLPVHAIGPVKRWLIETVAQHTHAGMGLVGYSPGLATGPEGGYLSLFAFDAHTTYIVLACTGIGSIAIFGGVILAAGGPLRRRLAATGLVAGMIYGLNLVRNVFVGLATPLGWFGGEPFATVAGVFGVEGARVSFFVSHTLIAQPLSLVALVALTVVALRVVPELFGVLDEAVFVVTGTEVDLRAEVGPTILGEGGRRPLEAAD